MTQHWTILNAIGEVVQPCCATPDADTTPAACGEPWEEGYQALAIDAAPALDRMIWSGSAWIVSPSVAHDERWEAAKAYREQRRNAPLGVWGVFPDRAVVVKMDVESRLTISGAVQMATLMKAAGLPFSFTFDDEAGLETTLDADQTIALGLNVATFSGICDGKLRDARIALKAALEAGATAEQILAIDITAGYPAFEE